MADFFLADTHCLTQAHARDLLAQHAQLLRIEGAAAEQVCMRRCLEGVTE